MKEKVLAFGPRGALVGILSEPDDRTFGRGKPAVLFANTGIAHRVGPFRLNVELARRLAALGYYAFRFDFAGLGDSAPSQELGDDYERAVKEARQAMDLLQKRAGVTRFVWFGLCSSADKGHVIALADPRVVGCVYIDGYAHKTWRFWVRRYTTRFLQWKRIKVFVKRRLKRWRARLKGDKADGPKPYQAVIKSPAPAKVERELMALAQRGVEQLHLFTISTDYTYNYAGQFWDLYPTLKGQPRVHTERYAEADHTLSFRAMQLLFIDRICRWMERF